MYEYFALVIAGIVIGATLIMMPKNENSDDREYYISYDGDLVWL